MRQLWNFWSGALSDTDVQNIIALAQNYPVQDAGISHENKQNANVRVSQIRWLTGNQEINDMLYRYVLEANRNAFGVDVTPFSNIQYTEYEGSAGGHYDWHNDVHWQQDLAFDRKLSVTVQLSDPEDYEGGLFEFKHDQPLPKEAFVKGSVLVFPSYLEHRVAPVTAGNRKSLVAWFEGPRWR